MPLSRMVMWILGLSLAALVSVWRQWPDDHFHLVACDVGQGDATLLVKGSIQVLIDGGPANGKVMECLTRHMPFWDRTIEVVTFSHPQDDHVGGLPEVIGRYRVKTLVKASAQASGALDQALTGVSQERGAKITIIRQGQQVKIGDVSLTAMWPPTTDFAGGEVNETSLVYRVTYGHFSALLTGDIEAQVEEELAAGGKLEPVDVLKVAHHGSKTSSQADFLQAVRPKLALVEVGAGNRFGHPSPLVIDRLRRAGIACRRTDTDGEIEVVSDGATFSYRATHN